MYKNILIATDGSELAKAALGQGLQLARSLQAKVTVVTVTQPWSAEGVREMGAEGDTEAYDKAAAYDADRILSAAYHDATAAGVSCETLHVVAEQPANALVSTAKNAHCDLIVIASPRHHGFSRFFKGDEAARVEKRTSLPVLICHAVEK